MKLLGVDLGTRTRQDILRQIEGSINPLFIASINPEILIYAWRHKDYRDILNHAGLRIVDGIGVVLMARLLYGVKLTRFPGADLAQEVINEAAEQNKKIFLIGGNEEANQRAIHNLNSKFKIQNSNVRGLGGEFNEQGAIKKILDYRPDILLVALGAPKQELFIHSLLTQYPQQHLPKISLGIGGTIDFWANPKLHAPQIVRRIGFEWLWRLVRQPWRLFRIFKAVVVFPLACLKERILLK